jgi:uncharacterized protein (TIGR03086 family)
MTNRDQEIAVLARGLDQAADLLGSVGNDDLDRPTPCHDWSAAELIDHLVAAPAKFARMVRGDEVDWSAPTPRVGDDRADVFRSGADELLAAWDAVGQGDAPMGTDMQSAEIAVHTYDLASALDRPTAELVPEVAERGLSFMQANLTSENRGSAFESEQAAPPGADAYQRLAAFSGRGVSASR